MIRAPLLSPLVAALRRPLGRRVTSDEYSVLRADALAAAARNNAVLWFVERDLSNVWGASRARGSEARTIGSQIGLIFCPNRDQVQLPASQIQTPAQWTKVAGAGSTVTLEPGRITIDSTTGDNASATAVGTSVGVAADQVYLTRVTIESAWGGGIRIDVGGTTGSGLNTPGEHVVITRAINNAAVRIVRHSTGGAVVTAIETRLISSSGAAQETATLKPTLVASPAGYYGLRFDGTDDHLRALDSPLTTSAAAPYTLIAACSTQTVSSTRTAVGDGRSIGILGNGSTASLDAAHAGSSRLAVRPLAVGELALATSSYTAGGSLRTRSGGVQASQAAVVAATSPGASGMFVGASSAAAEFWQGDVFLVCAAPNVMPIDDVRTIERFGALLSGAQYSQVVPPLRFGLRPDVPSLRDTGRVQVMGQNVLASTVGAGIFGPGPNGTSELKHGIVTEGGAGTADDSAFLFRVWKNDPNTSGASAQRSERYFSLPEQQVLQNTDLWFAVRLKASQWDSDTRRVIWQWHEASPVSGLSPHLSAMVNGNRLRIIVLHNSNAVLTSASTTQVVIHTDEAWQADTWYDFVVKARVDPEAAGSGYVKVWVNGTLVADYVGPIGYKYDSPADYAKVGIYHWNSETNQWRPGAPEVIEVKVASSVLLLDAQDVDQEVVRGLIR